MRRSVPGHAEIPACGQAEGVDGMSDKTPVNLMSRNGEDAPDVPNVFFAAALAMELEFPQDDVFWRREPDVDAHQGNPPPVFQSPIEEGMVARRIAIGFQSGLRVDDVEVAAGLPRRLDFNDFQRRKVERRRRKEIRDNPARWPVQQEDNVNIEGRTGLPVLDRGHRARNHVTADPGILEREDEKPDQVRFGG